MRPLAMRLGVCGLGLVLGGCPDVVVSEAEDGGRDAFLSSDRAGGGDSTQPNDGGVTADSHDVADHAQVTGCTIEGITFDADQESCLLELFETMTCDACNELFDSRICEDAINDAAQCHVGQDCTGCDDGDNRADGVTCEEIDAYSYFGATAAATLLQYVQQQGCGDVVSDGGEADADAQESVFDYDFDELTAGEYTSLELPGVVITGLEGVVIFRDQAPYYVESRPNYIAGLPDYRHLTLTFTAPSREVRLNLIAVADNGPVAAVKLYSGATLVATLSIEGLGDQSTPVPLDLGAHGLLDRVELTEITDDRGIGVDDLHFER